MKRKQSLLLLLFLLFSIHGMAQTYYYYYKGAKVPLSKNEEKVCISIPKDCDETVRQIRANVQVLSTIKDDYFDIIVVSRSDFEQLTLQDFWVENAKSVLLSSSFFTENNDEVYLTPYLTVKLKQEQDLDLLTAQAEKYRLRIIKEDTLMPLWYQLSITLDSEKNSMECANEIFESGLFAVSKPDLAPAQPLYTDIQYLTIKKTGKIPEIFDLQGCPLSTPPSRGMYIQNGKKVWVKD